MAAFVVLALAVVVATAGMVVVAAVVLRRQVRGLLRAVEDAGSSLGELASELEAEASVTGLETERLSERVSNGQGGPPATIRRA